MLKREFLLCPALAAACFLTGLPALAQSSAKPVLITQAVSDSNLVTITGTTRPEAVAANDAGKLNDDTRLSHMLLQLKRSPQQEQALEALLEAQQDKTSPNYQKWISAADFGSRFGLASSDLTAIANWLTGHGFTVNSVYPNGILIDFSGTAGQVRGAFHTEIHNINVNGSRYIANMSDQQIPAAFADAVAGVVSLNNFPAKKNFELRTNYTAPISGTTYYLVAPPDMYTIYNFKPIFASGISGQGQTLAVVEDGNLYSTNDVAQFRAAFGLNTFYPSGNVITTHPPSTGTNNCQDPGVNGASTEVAVDAEYASAAAPSATINVASCADGSMTFGFFIALVNLVNSNNPPPTISMSYGLPEALVAAPQNVATSAAYQQAVAEGVSVFVSSGDSGAAITDRFFAPGNNATHGISVNGFASTAYNVAVGGTDFGDTYNGTNTTYWSPTNSRFFGSALSYINEIPWDDSCADSLLASFFGLPPFGSGSLCNSTEGAPFVDIVAGSGGPSNCFTGSIVAGTCRGLPKPSWQSGFAGIPNDGVRDIPDVSLFAANGLWLHFYPLCFSDPAEGGVPCTGAPNTWLGAGGTSFSAPIMAGVQALINQKLGHSTGNPNPTYYHLARLEYGATGSSTCNSSLAGAVANTCTFYDVTQGTIDVNCTGTNDCFDPSGHYGVLSTSDSSYQPAYAATIGWDFATGIGTVNVTNLVNAYVQASH